MATVIDKPDPAAKYAARVDEQVAEAAGRVRGHDLTLGGLLLGGVILGYAVAVMSLDKAVVLPEWSRQLLLAGLAVVTAGVAFRYLVRPLRDRVNPLYAAVLVERTIDDAKNSVVGYVEAKERADVHPSVKAAMGARAAKSVTDADVNHAVDHRGLVYAGGVVVALFLVLVALFFVFRPAQFQSLATRAFLPFSSDAITGQTQITLVEPNPGDVTLTTGQSLPVRVNIGGRIPKPDRPDRVRVLVRYTTATAAYDEIPLEPTDTARDWAVQLRPEQLRTGAWYKVAAGDAETPEYRVTVRTAPLFNEYEVEYHFPAYTRRPSEKSPDAHLYAIRNTKVTVVAKANRPVRDGRAAFEPAGQLAVAGKLVGDDPNALRFDFLLTTPGSYRLAFTAADGEKSQDTTPFGIKLEDDLVPTVDITTPEPDEIPLAANGLLAVDGAAGDDYGLDKLTLKFRLADATPKALADRPFQKGKSFRRDADGTYPRSLTYKDSVELSTLTDAAGEKVELKEGMLLEYWLEATDNRTKPSPAGPEPDPQTGKSRVKRVRLTPPVTPEQKQEQDARRDQRKNEEQKHNADQQQRLDQEPRPQPNDPKAPPPEPKKGEDNKQGEPGKKGEAGKQGNDTPMPGGMNKMPPDKGDMTKGMGQAGDMNKMPPDPAMPPPPDKKGAEAGMTGKGTETNPDRMGTPGGMPMTDPNGMGGMKDTPPPTAPMPSDPGRKDVQKNAEDVQKQLNQEQNGGGDPKAAPTADPNERTDPANQKSNPPPDAKQPEAKEKQNDGGMGASEPRNDGNVKEPDAPSAPKPEGKTDPMGGQKGNAATGEKRNDPLGGEPGQEREPTKGDPMANPMDKGAPQKGDPKAGGEPKAGPQDKGGDPMSGDPMAGKGQPDPGRAKAAPPSADRGMDREPQPKAGPDARPQDGGGAKSQVPPEPGMARPGTKDPESLPPDQNAKANSGEAPGNAAEPRAAPKAGDDTKGGMPQAKQPEPGTDRGAPGDKAGPPPEAPMPKSADQTANKGGSPKLDPMQKAELDQAARDLTNPDPAKKKAAQDKLDNAIGKQGREQIEDITKGLNSDDPNERARAQQKLDDLRKQAAQAGNKQPDPKTPEPMPGGMGTKNPPDMGKGPMQKIDPKELEQAAKDLTSKDEATRQAARDKLDKTVGEQARKQAEELIDDLNSNDPERQARARERLEELRRQAEQQMANNPPMPKGQPDPMPGGKNPDEKFGPHAGGNDPRNAPPMADDPRNRAKSAELTLDRFERNRFNRDLHDRLGWTQEEYDRFLADYRSEVERLRCDAADAELAAPTPAGPPPRPIDINSGGKLDRGAPGTGTAGVRGPAFAAPGYSDALRRFQEGATQRPTPKR